MRVGLKNAITDVAGLMVGNAEDTRIKTGVTVLTAQKPFVASMHIMGGAPGTFDTALLAPDKTVSQIDALVLSGGSAFGLSACSGVMDAMRAQGRGFQVGDCHVPICPGAIIFDLLNGGDKEWECTPYYKLGQAAYEAAGLDFKIGTAGAGTGALCADYKGGLGTASYITQDGWTVGALVVANPLGAVTTETGDHFWAAAFEQNSEYGGYGPAQHHTPTAHRPRLKSERLRVDVTPQSNTTIAIIATDAPLTKAQCHRLSVAAHDGIARAIVPAHTPYDGDLVFALSAGAQDAVVNDHCLLELGATASMCLARAIARGVFKASPQSGDIFPCISHKGTPTA